MTEQIRRFDVAESLCLADEILSRPPAKPFISRPDLLPTRVFRAALPSELCMAANATMRRGFADAGWKRAKVKTALWSYLSVQALPWRSKLGFNWPFDGQWFPCCPQVLAIKFSSHAPDVGANFGKMAIDMLTQATTRCPNYRIGIVVDDRPSCVEQVHYWEFLPQKHHAFVVIEVRV